VYAALAGRAAERRKRCETVGVGALYLDFFEQLCAVPEGRDAEVVSEVGVGEVQQSRT